MKKKVFRILFCILSLLLIPAAIASNQFCSCSMTQAFVSAYEKALPAVVFIAAEKNPFDLSYGSDPSSYYEYLRPFYEMLWPPKFGHGSGFIVSADGYVVTNRHVIQEASSVLIALQNPDLKIYKATVIGSDPRSDIAVLKIENKDGIQFPYLKFGNSHQAKVGEQVIAVGNPINPELQSTVTMGVISAKERNNFSMDVIEGYIQTDASVNGGNSGGPLLNYNGEVIGIITWCYSHYLGREGLGFAIPSHNAELIANQIISKGKVSQGYLGVELAQYIESAFDLYDFDCTDGAHILKVMANSPAKKAGLEVGDTILEINQYPITSALSLKNQVWVLEPKTTIQLKVERDGSILEMSVELEGTKLSTSSYSSKLII